MNDHRFIREIRLLRNEVPSFNDYPFSLPAIRHLDTLSLDADVTFFIGENGTGKSTLLEAIAGNLGLNPEGGSRNMHFATRTSHSVLDEYIRTSRSSQRPDDTYFLRSESFFNVATEIERLDEGDGGPRIIDSYGGQSLHEQSHGESFYALFMNRLSGCGVYLMDEPEAALSPTRQLGLLAIMHNLIKTGSQFIAATHSPILMGYPGARLYEFGQDGIQPIAYHDTDHYQVTKRFLDSPDKMFSILFEDE